jgi:hypothetical protein
MSRPSKSFPAPICHQNKNSENQESILYGGFELAKSNLIRIVQFNTNKHFKRNHDFAAKKLIRSVFKLLFWRLDFLLFLFLYQDKKRKIKFAENQFFQ